MFFLKHHFLGKSEMSFSFDWDRSWNSAKTDQPEMDSFLEKRNPDQKWPDIETYKFAQNVLLWTLQCDYEIWNDLKTYGTKESRS